MKSCRCCESIRNNRKDFRQDHGGGPEIPPHRKAGGKKRERSDHKHIYATNTYRERWRHWDGRLSNELYVYEITECVECGRKPKRKYWW